MLYYLKKVTYLKYFENNLSVIIFLNIKDPFYHLLINFLISYYNLSDTYLHESGENGPNSFHIRCDLLFAKHNNIVLFNIVH